MKLVWSYFVELLSSIFDENLKKLWAIIKGTFLTLFKIMISPCHDFPLPKKKLIEIVSDANKAQVMQVADKSGYINDINFTKNTILLVLALVIGDIATHTNEVQGQVSTSKILVVFFYFVGFLVFLSVGRIWANLFGDKNTENRRVDSWFSFEYNMTFLVIFIFDYVASNILDIKDLLLINRISFALVLIHLFYLAFQLQSKAQKKVNNAYYWGINTLFVLFLSISVLFIGFIQVSIKEDMQPEKYKKELNKGKNRKEETAPKKEAEEAE